MLRACWRYRAGVNTHSAAWPSLNAVKTHDNDRNKTAQKTKIKSSSTNEDHLADVANRIVLIAVATTIENFKRVRASTPHISIMSASESAAAASFLLSDIGTSRFLPTVGTPHATLTLSALDAHASTLDTPDTLALCALSLWEDFFFPVSTPLMSTPSVVSDTEVARFHFGRKAEDFLSSSEKTLTYADALSGISNGSLKLPVSLTCPKLRAAMAQSVLRGQRTKSALHDALVDSIEAMWSNDVGLCVKPLPQTTLPRSVQADVALYTLLLLSEYRATKSVAAQKWIRFAAFLCGRHNADVATPQGATSAGDEMVRIAVASSMLLIIPSRQPLTLHEDCLPQLQGSFVALFWMKVIEILSTNEFLSKEQGSVEQRPGLRVSDVVGALLDLFCGVVRAHLAGNSSPPDTQSYFDISAGSAGGGLPECDYDCIFGGFFPLVWQQTGYEWPWSALRRMTMRLVNAAASGGGVKGEGTSSVSERADGLWSDIVEALATRSYRERLEQVLPSSLSGYILDTYAVEDFTASKQHFVLSSSDSFAVSLQPVVHDTIDRFSRVCSAGSSGLHRRPGDDVAARQRDQLVDSVMFAIDALPSVVQLRIRHQASPHTEYLVERERLTSLAWVFLHSTKLLSNRELFTLMFTDYFGKKFETLRNACRDAAAYEMETQPAVSWSPFVEATKRFLQEKGLTENRSARRCLCNRLLHFLTLCFLLPVASSNRQKYCFGVTSEDLEAALRFASPSWRECGMQQRLLVRANAAKVHRRAAEASKKTIDAVEARLLDLEIHGWSNSLRRLFLSEKASPDVSNRERGARDGEVVWSLDGDACTQASLLRPLKRQRNDNDA